MPSGGGHASATVCMQGSKHNLGSQLSLSTTEALDLELKLSGSGGSTLAAEPSHSLPLTSYCLNPTLDPFAFAASMGGDTEAQDRITGQQRATTSPTLVP